MYHDALHVCVAFWGTKFVLNLSTRRSCKSSKVIFEICRSPRPTLWRLVSSSDMLWGSCAIFRVLLIWEIGRRSLDWAPALKFMGDLLRQWTPYEVPHLYYNCSPKLVKSDLSVAPLLLRSLLFKLLLCLSPLKGVIALLPVCTGTTGFSPLAALRSLKGVLGGLYIGDVIALSVGLLAFYLFHIFSSRFWDY